LTIEELDSLASARLMDARALLEAGRHQGAKYLAGYAVELKLKARIARTLGWSEFPPEDASFTQMPLLKTHKLHLLLLLSGVKARILGAHAAEWAAVLQWDPEQRYEAIDSVSARDAQSFVEAVKSLVVVL
jgi:HEPN domain-containing protein